MKFPIRLLQSGLAVLGLAAAAALAGGCDDSRRGSVKNVKPAQMRSVLANARGDAPGIAAGLISDDAIVLAADGYLSSNGNAPLRTDNWLHLGSNSKSMTAMAIAVQVERGTLRWNDTLEKLFPELAATMRPEYRSRTLLEVLSYRAGLQQMLQWVDFDAVPITTTTLPQQRMEFARWLLAQPPVNVPGTEGAYSNASYVLAGAILERASGMAFEESMQETLLKPLGLRGVYGLPQSVGADQPAGHLQVSPGVFQPVLPDDPLVQALPKYINSAGLLAMPLPDYARYAQIHLRALRGKPTLLKAETYKVLHTPVGQTVGTSFADAPGWVVNPDAKGNKVYGFLGSIDIMNAGIKIVPKDNRAVVVLNNYDALENLEALMEGTGNALLALKRKN